MPTTYRPRWEILLATGLAAALLVAGLLLLISGSARGSLFAAAVVQGTLAVAILRSRRLSVSDEFCVEDNNGFRTTYRWVDLIHRKRGMLHFTTGKVEHSGSFLDRHAAKRARWRVPVFLYLRDSRVLPIGAEQ
ncbi:hypothetical protein [Actinokineospora diospyrosa]|uniref:PH (Pleckstrin Homology) domain-containing protein n=1 Tax=Actinokineospora diospyrosa TaxID=103728 RepID=A0ABT1IGB7_9PSEU|nr:hypothetical protein [Actinokineospora diospyrosa]MCP2271693.1 hypothetical protein [Actinokineospora diospyrosa]